MTAAFDILFVAFLGFMATVSNMAGAALGLYFPLSKRLLSCILAFAAGGLISALAIDLAFGGATQLHDLGFSANAIWAFVGGGFALGAVFYYLATLALDNRGGAIRSPFRFREYALKKKRQNAAQTIKLLSQCDLLRHLPPEAIEPILAFVGEKKLAAGDILFRADDPADALYIVASGKVEVLEAMGEGDQVLAELGPGQAFGEMALLTGGARTATIRAMMPTELLMIERKNFETLVANDRKLATATLRLSHDRAMRNLNSGGAHPATWMRIASRNLDNLSRSESADLLAETADGAGLAIVFGNILDTIPGCLVIGAKFVTFQNLPLPLLIGMFVSGIPEAAASAAMLRKAGYTPKTIFLLWSMVMLCGILAAIAGKVLLGGPQALTQIFCQEVAGGAVLALVAHAMIPEAVDEAGTLIVLPTVGGFLAALYLVIAQSFG